METAEFVKHIVENILNKRISSANNFGYGGSYNTLRQCIDRNLGIGPKVIITLSNMIKISTQNNPSKKKEIIEFLKIFLSPNELEYIKKNPEDIKSVVKFAAAKVSKNKKKITDKDLEEFRIMDVDQLLNENWTIEKMVSDAINLDFETIEDITPEHNGDLKQWSEIARENSDTLRYLINKDNKMIGYWHCTPLIDDFYKKAKNGKLLDSEITLDTIPIMFPGTYNIYFIGICLQEKYRRKSATFGKLIFSVVYALKTLAEKNIFINEICALAYTTNGVRLCESIGLKYLQDHIEHGKIYCGHINDLLNKPFCKDFTELKELYKNKK